MFIGQVIVNQQDYLASWSHHLQLCRLKALISDQTCRPMVSRRPLKFVKSVDILQEPLSLLFLNNEYILFSFIHNAHYQANDLNFAFLNDKAAVLLLLSSNIANENEQN